MTYTSFHISTRKNFGRTTLRCGAVCSQCQQPIARGHRYTVHAVRTAAMPASGCYCYHAEHAPKRGSGWGDLRAGKSISDFSELNEGDLLLDHSVQFDAFNVIRVVKTRCHGEPHDLDGRKFYGMFVDPSDLGRPRLCGDEPICVWDHQLGGSRELYRPVARPAGCC